MVPYNRGGIGYDGYIWKYSLSVNFFSLLSPHNIFWILLVNFVVGSFSAIFAFPSCSSIFYTAFFSDNTTNPEPLSNGQIVVSLLTFICTNAFLCGYHFGYRNVRN